MDYPLVWHSLTFCTPLGHNILAHIRRRRGQELQAYKNTTHSMSQTQQGIAVSILHNVFSFLSFLTKVERSEYFLLFFSLSEEYDNASELRAF